MKTYETRFWMLLVNLCRFQEDGFDTYAKVKEAVDEEYSLGQTSTNTLLRDSWISQRIIEEWQRVNSVNVISPTSHYHWVFRTSFCISLSIASGDEEFLQTRIPQQVASSTDVLTSNFLHWKKRAFHVFVQSTAESCFESGWTKSSCSGRWRRMTSVLLQRLCSRGKCSIFCIIFVTQKKQNRGRGEIQKGLQWKVDSEGFSVCNFLPAKVEFKKVLERLSDKAGWSCHMLHLHPVEDSLKSLALLIESYWFLLRYCLFMPFF